MSAINAEGTGPASNIAHASTGVTIPGAPTNLTAAAQGQTQIALFWAAPSDTGGAAVTGYRIEVSENAGLGWVVLVQNTGSTSTTHSHTGLAAGTTRHYRVSAINAAGIGPASNCGSGNDGCLRPRRADEPDGQAQRDVADRSFLDGARQRRRLPDYRIPNPGLVGPGARLVYAGRQHGFASEPVLAHEPLSGQHLAVPGTGD